MQRFRVAIIVAGLTAQQAVATGHWSVDAKAYSCPANTNNNCSSSQSGGYDWSSLSSGSFSSYGSNAFKGFTCSDSSSEKSGLHKRHELMRRGIQSKCISGSLDEKPSMSCSGSDSFSVDHYHISTSHDTAVDCVYSMPDGSSCTETHSCSSQGSIIKNNQCGGATSVTFQPQGGSIGSPGSSSSSGSINVSKVSSSSTSEAPTSVVSAASSASTPCTLSIHSIGFNCETASSTVPASTANTVKASSSAGPSVTVASASAVPASTSASSGSGSSVETSPVAASAPITAASSSTSPGSSSATDFYPQRNLSSIPVVSADTSTAAVSFTTSTLITTTVATITSCAADVTSCPAESTVVVTSTIALSTTVCPVTATNVFPASSSSAIAYTSNSTALATSVAAASGSVASPAPGSSSSAMATPNAPGVLPSCLNTWLYETGCSDNTDYSCYCKNPDFITHVMGCISSWSSSDDNTTAAASYLMGICAPYVPSNPAIITACPSTITPAATQSTGAAQTAAPSTVTIYSTQEYTVTSCAPSVTDCPASSTNVITSTLPISTSIISASVVAAADSTSPAITSAPAVLSTIITYSSPVTVPAIYSTGISSGLPMVNSSTTSTLVTSVTVPQVQFSTTTFTLAGQTSTSTVLAAGSPPAAATQIFGAVGVSSALNNATGYGTGTGFYSPESSATGPISPIYKGAAANVSGFTSLGIFLGVLAGLFAL